MSYRRNHQASHMNRTVDLVNPTTVTDHTAATILNVLQADPYREVFAEDVIAALDANPLASSAPSARRRAFKALRNMGFPFYVHKASKLTFYVLAGTSEQYEEYKDRQLSEDYSKAITSVRQYTALAEARPNDPVIRSALIDFTQTAMSAGQRSKVPLTQIVKDLQPLTT